MRGEFPVCGASEPVVSEEEKIAWRSMREFPLPVCLPFGSQESQAKTSRSAASDSPSSFSRS